MLWNPTIVQWNRSLAPDHARSSLRSEQVKQQLCHMGGVLQLPVTGVL